MFSVSDRLYFCQHTKTTAVVFFYTLFVHIYVFIIRITALWNKKASEWINGRKNIFDVLEKKISQDDKIIWVHCASAGELEQGKPLIEQLKNQYPAYKILVSFFSPSGFAVAKKYDHADMICYLPADTRKNANHFIALVKPELVIFVKYEFWYHHLAAVTFHHIPLLLVSAIFREGQAFFKWYGKFYRQILFLFRHIFVQDKASLELLRANSIAHCSISGDTRFDRVKKIAGHFTEVPFIKEFIGSNQVIVAGSTWADDEKILSQYLQTGPVKLILAPHEIDEQHLQKIENFFPDPVRYSLLQNNPAGQSRVLIIDN